jgi:hypothetical protein
MNRTDALPVMDGNALRRTLKWIILSRRSIRTLPPVSFYAH